MRFSGWLAGLLAATLTLASGAATAQSVLKVGLVLPLTGAFASTGKQAEAGARLYLQQHGATVAGQTIELVVRDDAGAAESSQRLSQELVVNEKAKVLMGYGLTPLALSVAPLATRAKVPVIVTAAATSSITEASPFIVRTSFTLPQVTAPLADWAARNGIKSAVTLVSDYGPGIDAERVFKARFVEAGGTVPAELRVPLRSPDFAPFLQRVADTKPDAVFCFVPSGAGSVLMKQFVERGLDKSGIKLIATGDVTDDDIVNDMGAPAENTVTSHHYSAAHDSPENKAFVAAFKAANKGLRPNFMAVGAYDGMDLLYAALKKTNGSTDGAALLEAMKGMSWTSPRGPVSIDPATRDIVQNVYVRRVQSQGGELYNVEFDTVPNVKDPGKAAK